VSVPIINCKLGTTDEFGDAVFYGIPVGGHTFYAVQLPYGNSGQKHQYIHTGFNQVTIRIK